MQPSPNSVDDLIRELIDTGRPTKSGEVRRILSHIAGSPFNQATTRVSRKYRGLSYQGRTVGNREDSLFFHLAKRVVVEEQWANGTTEQDYLGDLRQAVQDPSARLVVYKSRGDNSAGVFAPNVVSASRQGPRPEPFIYVIYSADRGIVVTGYQASSPQEVEVPGSARWLN